MSVTENMPKGRVTKWQYSFVLKAGGPLCLEGTLSGEGQALSILLLLVCSPCHGKLWFSSRLWKGSQPGQVLEQEVHPGPAARSVDPDKSLPDNIAFGELQGWVVFFCFYFCLFGFFLFFIWFFLFVCWVVFFWCGFSWDWQYVRSAAVQEQNEVFK